MTEPKTADSQFMIGQDAHLNIDNPGGFAAADTKRESVVSAMIHDNYEGKPSEEQLKTLRRVAGKLPMTTYVLCFVEFCERGSYYSSVAVISNFVNRPLPKGGNGKGAPGRGTQQTAGALGKGTKIANAVSQSFKISSGVAVCGIAHVLMLVSGAPSLLQGSHSEGPFILSLYVLAVGAAMFKPNVAPILLDQIKETKPTLMDLPDGETVIIDPEATTERVVLWFYLLINVGGFLGVPASYTEKYVGWWLTFLLPLLIYVPLPFVLWWIKKRLTLYPPGGSDLGNCFLVLGVCLKKGIFRIGKKGFWDAAKPSILATEGNSRQVPWTDGFVDDVRRTFQATGIFCFFPIQYVNDNGLGISTDALTTMLTTNGVPNDVLYNTNSLIIIICAPLLNFGLYPLFRRLKIHYGPIARITTGLFISTLGDAGYTVLNYYAYKLGPCGDFGSSATCVDADGISLVAPITIWWIALPYMLGGISELFVNVPAYGIAYSRAPVNMRGLVSAINLFSTGVAYALGLVFSGLIADPYLTWVFAGPTIAGGVCTVIFWFLFKHIDKEEFELTKNDYRDVVAPVPVPEGSGSSLEGEHVKYEKVAAKV